VITWTGRGGTIIGSMSRTREGGLGVVGGSSVVGRSLATMGCAGSGGVAMACAGSCSMELGLAHPEQYLNWNMHKPRKNSGDNIHTIL